MDKKTTALLSDFEYYSGAVLELTEALLKFSTSPAVTSALANALVDAAKEVQDYSARLAQLGIDSENP